MRALGPASVSSFLKIVLDIVYAALLVGVAAVGLMAFADLMFTVNPALLDNVEISDRDQLVERGPVLMMGLLAAGFYMAGVLVIIRALRRIFATLTAGDPFRPDNVGRLRVIALMLSILELGRYAFWSISAWLPAVHHVRPSFGLTAWFSVLVVLVLAEVFREGARLRREAELTI
jgi:hypothetical protein